MDSPANLGFRFAGSLFDFLQVCTFAWSVFPVAEFVKGFKKPRLTVMSEEPSSADVAFETLSNEYELKTKSIADLFQLACRG